MNETQKNESTEKQKTEREQPGTSPLEDIPILNEEFDEYLRKSAAEEQLYSIALFDILGFSDFVEQNGTEVIMDLYQRLLELVYRQQSSKEGELTITGVVPVPTSADCTGSFYIAQGNGYVNVIHFSDTFILYVNYDIKAPGFWLRDSKYESHPLVYNEDGTPIPENFFRNAGILPSFLQTCMEFFCSALIAGIPLRGCISTGIARMDKFQNLYIGKPLVEAAKGETARKSIGITYGKSFCHYHSIYHDYHIPYLANIKEEHGAARYLSPMAVDWPRYWRNRTDFHQLSIEDCINKMNHDERHSEYYDNAIAFARFSEKHDNWAEEINYDNVKDIFDFYKEAEKWYLAVSE